MAVALFAAGCGGSSFKADPAGDLARAKRARLVAADLPEFKATRHKKSSQDTEKEDRKLAKCLQVDASVFDETPGAQVADSPDFVQGDLRVESRIEIDPKKSDIDKRFARALGQRIPELFREVLQGGDRIREFLRPGREDRRTGG